MDKRSRTRRERGSCDRQVAAALRAWATTSPDEARTVGDAAEVAARHGTTLAVLQAAAMVVIRKWEPERELLLAVALEGEGQVILDPGNDDEDPWASGAGAPDNEEEGLE
jgi:hypothetical protein